MANGNWLTNDSATKNATFVNVQYDIRQGFEEGSRFSLDGVFFPTLQQLLKIYII